MTNKDWVLIAGIAVVSTLSQILGYYMGKQSFAPLGAKQYCYVSTSKMCRVPKFCLNTANPEIITDCVLKYIDCNE